MTRETTQQNGGSISVCALVIASFRAEMPMLKRRDRTEAEKRNTQWKTAMRRLPACYYCGGEGGTIDHVVPRTLGGEDTPDNAVPCCPACNFEKDSILIERWFMHLWWAKDERAWTVATRVGVERLAEILEDIKEDPRHWQRYQCWPAEFLDV